MTHKNEHSTGCDQIADFSIRVGDDESFDQRLRFEDPLPTGRQIIREAGRKPIIEHQLLLLTKDRRLEEIGLDETVDLRKKGAERFFIFRTDCLFQFVIDEQRFSWGSSKISESTLRFLAGVGDEYSVWQERRGEDDTLIEPGSSACLNEKGVELFFTGKDQTNAG